jgi:hypothetical protein
MDYSLCENLLVICKELIAAFTNNTIFTKYYIYKTGNPSLCSSLLELGCVFIQI